MELIVCPPYFTGFLTAVYDSYYEKKSAEKITANFTDIQLADTFSESGEDLEKARKVRDGIIKKGGLGFYTDIMDAYRSGQNGKEQIIADYLRLFFSRGKAVTSMFDRQEVVDFNDILRKVYHEMHRLTAFVRFQEMSNGVYYGYFTSDNDILELITRDLKSRLNDQPFILHDITRKKMAFYNGDECVFDLAPDSVEIELSDRELVFQELWRQYHQNVNIKERENLRLQRGFLPKKYRHFMSEFK